MLLQQSQLSKDFFNKQIDDITTYSNMNNMKINVSEEEISEKELPVESVLVLQGGGSLGAYECGVYKTLSRHSIKFDIVSGTSIGALNAAIIAAYSYDSAKDSTGKLENFWLELAETLIPLPQQFSLLYFTD